MKRPGYREAIRWIAANDDCDWLTDGEDGGPSVTACMVADLFGVDQERVTADLARAHECELGQVIEALGRTGGVK